MALIIKHVPGENDALTCERIRMGRGAIKISLTITLNNSCNLVIWYIFDHVHRPLIRDTNFYLSAIRASLPALHESRRRWQ